MSAPKSGFYHCGICGKEHVETLKAQACCRREKQMRRQAQHEDRERRLIDAENARQLEQKRRDILEGE